MQKKILGIWFSVKAQDMYLGWYSVELQEKFSSPNPFASIPKPVNMTPYLYPNLQGYEPKYPTWMKKNFPYESPDEQIMFPIPFTEYQLTFNWLLNESYAHGLKSADYMIKAYMKAYNLSNTPKNAWLYTFVDAYTKRNIISPYEFGVSDFDKNIKVSSMENKFLSEWLDGTYEIGYATNPYNPSFSFNKFSFNIKGSSTSLTRGIVYGAVKYDGKWLAARIVKNK